MMTPKHVPRPLNKMKEVRKDIDISEHKIGIEEVLLLYKSNLTNGLSSVVAQELLIKNGPNSLTPTKQKPLWALFLKQISNGFAILLWLGAFFSIIAFLLNYSKDKSTSYSNIYLAVVLVLVNLITGCFSFYQEYKSSQILESFKKMLPEQALVIRDGKKLLMPAQNIVVGDIVIVETGSRIPADVRILSSSGLKVDNSSLTGEAEAQSRIPNCTHDNPLETKNLGRILNKKVYLNILFKIFL
jgi:magnesium-transporting ATPase (P-type)